MLLTEWPEFRDVDFKELRQTMQRPVIIDGRNFLNRQYLRELNFEYLGMGQ